MPKRYSIAEARANLPTIVDEVEAGSTIELTRRGKPIAVVLSRQQYDALRSERPRFSEAYRLFLERFRLEEIGVDRDYFDSLRAAGPGRKVAL
ncbi:MULTISPECIES: type II toxin-antitoxin system Phd/YefM family antitoxin [Sorangium]|uniref:type II toxin-antitoxin system Phd/YefM family antitoxin n=1 Tax=Sorangium TaxID=39643 RepID=UPI003D9C58C4